MKYRDGAKIGKTVSWELCPMPKRAKTVSLLSVTGSVLLLAIVAFVYREEIGAWLRGYRVIWLEEGVAPTSIGDLFGS